MTGAPKRVWIDSGRGVEAHRDSVPSFLLHVVSRSCDIVPTSGSGRETMPTSGGDTPREPRESTLSVEGDIANNPFVIIEPMGRGDGRAELSELWERALSGMFVF